MLPSTSEQEVTEKLLRYTPNKSRCWQGIFRTLSRHGEHGYWGRHRRASLPHCSLGDMGRRHTSLGGFAQGVKGTGDWQLLSLNSLISRSSGSLQMKNEKSGRGKNYTSWLNYQQMTPIQHVEKGEKMIKRSIWSVEIQYIYQQAHILWNPNKHEFSYFVLTDFFGGGCVSVWWVAFIWYKESRKKF